MMRMAICLDAKDEGIRDMRDDEILSHSATFQTETSWRRLAPFATVLVVLLGTVALGGYSRTHNERAAQAEPVAMAQSSR
jgi:hypothetical protein